MSIENNFPDFKFQSDELSAFILSMNIFIIGLKNGRTITYEPNDKDQFKAWLISHHVRDITTPLALAF